MLFYSGFLLFILSIHFYFLDPLGEKNRSKRVFIKFYKTEGLGQGGFSASLVAVEAGFSALPLCEKSVPLLSRSLV